MEDAAFVYSAKLEGSICFGESTFALFTEADDGFLWGSLLRICQIEIDKAHSEHVVGEKSELIFLSLVVWSENNLVPKESEFLLVRGLESGR